MTRKVLTEVPTMGNESYRLAGCTEQHLQYFANGSTSPPSGYLAGDFRRDFYEIIADESLIDAAPFRDNRGEAEVLQA